MFDNKDMAMMIGASDAQLNEAPTHVTKFPGPVLKFAYLSGWYGFRYTQLKAKGQRVRDSYLDLFFLGSR